MKSDGAITKFNYIRDNFFFGVKMAKAAKVKSEVMGKGDSIATHQWIADEAYYLAEKRGFEPGHELEDWLAAEGIRAGAA